MSVGSGVCCGLGGSSVLADHGAAFAFVEASPDAPVFVGFEGDDQAFLADWAACAEVFGLLLFLAGEGVFVGAVEDLEGDGGAAGLFSPVVPARRGQGK